MLFINVDCVSCQALEISAVERLLDVLDGTQLVELKAPNSGVSFQKS